MIKSVTVVNYVGESLKINLTRPEETGLYIKKIDGLGPTKANINITELVTTDGARRNSVHKTSRNIVIYLGFFYSPTGPTIEELRLKTYRYFPVKQEVKLIIETDHRTCETKGTVESNEPDIFSKEEGCQISILCEDSYFQSKNEHISDLSELLIPYFEFPFSNESLDERLIVFDDTVQATSLDVYNDGDAEVGVTILVHLLGTATGLTFYNLQTRQRMSLNDEKLITALGSPLQLNDDIIINTVTREKSVSVMRNGRVTNIINALEKPLQWITLSKGSNIIGYTLTSGDGHVTFKVKNKILYEGV